MKLYQFLLILLLVLSCQSTKNELPILSYTINTEGEKEIYSITYSEFINQDKQEISAASLKDNVMIANFFFTRCPSICPPMRSQLIIVAETFKDEDAVLLISHTIDPINDTVEVLKDYSENTGITSHKWQFLRSTEQNTKALAKQYMTNFRPNEDGTEFYHSSYVALLDKQQRIRGFYNILVTEDVERLVNDTKALLH